MKDKRTYYGTDDNDTSCWFVYGRIKEKIGFRYAIKYQVFHTENTAQWLVNTVQLCLQPMQSPPLIIFPAYKDF